MGKEYRGVEDERLLAGAGRFTAALDLPGQAHVAFVRSPEAHAEIRSLDSGAASVATVFSASSLAQTTNPMGWKTLLEPGSLPDHLDPTQPSLSGDELCPPPGALPIVVDRVPHVGEIVAVVVAETAEEAVDAAAEMVVVGRNTSAVTDARTVK